MYLCSSLSYSSKPKNKSLGYLITLSPKRPELSTLWSPAESATCTTLPSLSGSQQPPSGRRWVTRLPQRLLSQSAAAIYLLTLLPANHLLSSADHRLGNLSAQPPHKDDNRLVLFPLFWGIVINFKLSHFGSFPIQKFTSRWRKEFIYMINQIL